MKPPQPQKALLDDSLKYRSIFENAIEGIFQTTPNGRYISANPALAKIYGYETPQALLIELTNIGEQLYVNSEVRAEFVKLLQTHDVVTEFEAQVYRKDGQIIWICENARAVRDEQGTLLYYEGTVEDITERRFVKSLLTGQNQILEAIATGMPLEDILVDLILFIEGHLSEGRAAILLLDQQDCLRLAAAPNLSQLYDLDDQRVKIGLGEGSCGTAAYLKQMVIVEDIQTHPWWEKYRHKALELGVKSCWSMPIFSTTGQVLGTFATYHTVPHRPSFTEQQLLTKATHLAGIAIERSLTEERLHHEAFYDSLTNLPNRAWFMQRLEQLLVETDRNSDFAVLFLDLDNFKVINDSLGHLAGDRLLQEIARRLETTLESAGEGIGKVARLGGDEFTILLEESCRGTLATAIAQAIHHQLTLPFDLEGQEVFTNASIGIVLGYSSYRQYQRPEELIRDADIAMYHAKALGKGRYAVFDATMHEQAVARLELETELRRAIKITEHQGDSEFKLNYQPIVSLITGKITGFEVLVRWDHPQRGRISPVEFIPVAEETKLILSLGEWVLATACQQIAQWKQKYPQAQNLYISVNCSSVQLMKPGLIDKIDQILDKTGLPGYALKLEITESLILETGETTLTLLKALKQRQIQLCIDDFGTGYSSLSRLYQLPIDTLKIDKSFVSEIQDDNSQWKMMGTIVTLARNLGMETIAEGIETPEQLTHLRQLRCQQGQGYYFAKPLAPEDAIALLLSSPQW